MRPVREWTRKDLEELLNIGEPEGIHLEYKRSLLLSRDKLPEITKAVSAFANSDGGVLVFGIEESKEEPSKPVKIDDGIGSEGLSREALDQMLASGISPAVPGLTIREIDLGNSRRTFVIEVPKPTAAAPHQASDKRYYRRYNFHSQPMHDFDVRHLMQRLTTPDLEVHCTAEGKDSPEGGIVQLALSVNNLSDAPALYTTLQVTAIGSAVNTISGIMPGARRSFSSYPQLWINRNSCWEKAHRISYNYIVPTSMPFFKGVHFSAGEVTIKLDGAKSDIIIMIEITCPGHTRTDLFRALLTNGSLKFEQVDGDGAGLNSPPPEEAPVT